MCMNLNKFCPYKRILKMPALWRLRQIDSEKVRKAKFTLLRI